MSRSKGDELTPFELYQCVQGGDVVEIRFGAELAKIRRGKVFGAVLSLKNGESSVRIVFGSGSFKMTPDSRARIVESAPSGDRRRPRRGRTSGY